MRRPMVAGNWKMHGTCDSVADLVEDLANQVFPSGVDVAVFPTSLHLGFVVECLEDLPVSVGAQNCAHEVGPGALTGEISSAQLVDAGCKLVLVGHSERRQIMGESNELLVRKFAAAQASGLTPVLCIGETLEQREAGETLEVVGQQLDSIIEELGIGA
ncbi:MAG TPA: triose-phosphate isomerase, partial [Pseudomonas sp.]|nr:triose-phosphate isomerase [Pseudomonas sp.]